MAELSVDDAQRLARLFLTGQAGDTDIHRLQNAVAEDQGVALELLTQMQTALDDSAPAGLSAEQDRSVNGRIEALIAPRVKKRGPFSFLYKLFRRQPKQEAEAKPTRMRRRGASAEAEPVAAPVPAPVMEPVAPAVSDDLGETLPGGGMEEMAPIAAAPANVPPPTASSSPAVETPKEKAPRKPLPAWLLPSLGAVLVLGIIVFAASRWLKRPKAVTPPPVAAVVAQPTARPTASPTPTGRARRGVAVAPVDQEPLPAEFKATTPIASGSSNINQ